MKKEEKKQYVFIFKSKTQFKKKYSVFKTR